MEERLSHLEGAYEQAVTKADLLEMERRMLQEFDNRLLQSERRMLQEADNRLFQSERRMLQEADNRLLQSENRMHKEMVGLIKWMAGMQLLTVGTTLAGVAALIQLLG